MSRQTPAALGYAMPAEWHPHAATWLSWPKDPLTWPDRVPQVEMIFLRMIEVLAVPACAPEPPERSSERLTIALNTFEQRPQRT